MCLTFAEDGFSTINKRLLGTRDNKVDLVLLCPGGGRLVACLAAVRNLDVDHLAAEECSASISRRDEDVLDAGRLGKLECKCMLTAASAKDQNDEVLRLAWEGGWLCHFGGWVRGLEVVDFWSPKQSEML